jgi:hypothetical protein|tara:strand:- start:3094 stop:3825 length:732 start_codon:yes stop_codon:yes gene_type:complete
MYEASKGCTMKDNIILKSKNVTPIKYDSMNVSHETVTNELALLSLGDFELLKINVNIKNFRKEIEFLKNDWVDYQPKKDMSNNRRGMALTNLPGKTHKDNPSLKQANYAENRSLCELEFNQYTAAYEMLPSLHHVFEMFEPVGRSVLIKLGTGGYFPAHRDQCYMPRASFRIAIFLQDCGSDQFDWFHENKKMTIEQGTAYYINTKKVHKTMSWAASSTHLIMNIPFNSNNIQKLIANLKYGH